MKRNLLVMERYILESLNEGPKGFSQIHQETQLDYGLLNNILAELVMKNMLSFNKGLYEINMKEKESWLPAVNGKKALQSEVRELVSTFAHDHFDEAQSAQLRIQKVSLTAEEEKIFQSYLINLEKFIQDIKKQNRTQAKGTKVKDQKVIVWGQANYGNLVQSTLRAI